jgi:tripartite-type tricarboxylate transporter receptor subunit TctC
MIKAAALMSACLLSLQAFQASAQEKRQIAPGYPSKPIRFVTTVAAGGGLDFITRTVANKVAERTGATIVVENMAGGNGAVAVNATVAAQPDGSFILSTGGSLPINTVFKKFERDVRTSLVPVAGMSAQPYLLYVPAASPVNSVKELIAYAKKNPGKLNYGSTGIGSVIHMGMELIEYAAGLDMAHVPYKGSAPAMVDLVSGRLDVYMASFVSGAQLVKAGKIRVIGVTTAQRVPDVPDVPTVAESGIPNYDVGNAYTLYTNGATPVAIVNGLNREVIAALNDPELRKAFAKDNSTPAPPRSSAELKKILEDEIARWESVVKAANIKLEN